MKALKFCSCIFLLLFLTSCLQTRSSIKEDSYIKGLQVQSANQTLGLQEIQDQMRELNGKIEVLESKLATQVSSSQDSPHFKALSEKVIVLEEAVRELDQKLSNNKVSSHNIKTNSINTSNAKTSGTIIKDNYKSAQYYFAVGEYKKAILAYEKYRTLNPNGKYYPTATHNIGISLNKLGLKKEAKSYFTEIVTSYKKAPEFKSAVAHLKK